MQKIHGGMPDRISMNVTLPKQSQDKPFGQKLAETISTGAALVGSALPSNPIVSAAISAATGVVNIAGTTSGTPYGGITTGGNTAGGVNLNAGSSNNMVGAMNSDIADMSRQNAQMMQVQIAMQRENAMFTSVSNVLKTKHDTVKNSISNIR